MKISELPYVTTTTDSDYVLAIQNGQTVRATATAFKGDRGDDGVDGVNGVGVPAGGVAGEVLKKVDGTDYNTEWGPASGGVVDLTSATKDYSLSVGETAFIDYTSATSVPLHVETVYGEYEISVIGQYSSTVNGSYGYLKPNNVDTATDAVSEHRLVNSSSGDTTSTNFRPYAGGLLKLIMRIQTATDRKIAFSESYCIDNGSVTSYRIHCRWTDTTTAWTSLGTITFPFAQSGKIVIKRVI